MLCELNHPLAEKSGAKKLERPKWLRQGMPFSGVANDLIGRRDSFMDRAMADE
jgi:hypothetical protein